jgi:hypothetical protein
MEKEYKFKMIPDQEPRFKVGDKLIADELTKEEFDVDYVTISSINKKNKVYHWIIENPYGSGGQVHSGYFFKDAKLYTNEHDIL